MESKIIHEGYWWLPDKPEKRVIGKLFFDQDGDIQLEIRGLINELKTLWEDGQEMIYLKFELLLGSSMNNIPITLQKVSLYNIKSGSSDYRVLSFYCKFAFIGVHFEKVGDITFRELWVHYSNLDEWVTNSGIVIPNYDVAYEQYTIEYKKPLPKQLTVLNGHIIKIDFEVNRPLIGTYQTNMCVGHTSYIKIISLVSLPLSRFEGIIKNVQNFLTIGISEPTYPEILKAITDSKEEKFEVEAIYPRRWNTPIDIYISGIKNQSRKRYPYNMLFTYPEISENIDYMLKSWLEKEERLEPLYKLYFGVLYSSNAYQEYQFLSLIQGIESYHRRTMNNTIWSKKQFERCLTTIVENVPFYYSKWLNDKLQFANEPSLRNRLKQIIEINLDILEIYVDDTDEFIKTIVDNRNYLTHYDRRLRTRQASEDQLYELNKKMMIIIEVLLLKELGFEPSYISASLSRKYKEKDFYDRVTW